MEHLTEPESVLFTGELEIPTDENKHAASGSRWLTIDGGDAVLALLERQTRQFSGDLLSALELLALEAEHRAVLVEIHQARPVAVESAVVVLDEGLRHRVWIHLSLPSLSLARWMDL